MATDGDITLDVSGFPSEIPCGDSHLSHLNKIIVKRYDNVLTYGIDYTLGFEFTQDGVSVDEINWCKTSDSITIKVTAKVKPEAGPTGMELLPTPLEGPATIISELESPYEGPSSLAVSLLVPASGPTGLTAIEEAAPVSGPTGLTAIEDTSICVSGSSQDGTWAETGTYNGKNYWYTSASGGRWIYWDSSNSYWAFSTSLGGTAGDNDNGGTHPWSGTWNTITVSQGEC